MRVLYTGSMKGYHNTPVGGVGLNPGWNEVPDSIGRALVALRIVDRVEVVEGTIERTDGMIIDEAGEEEEGE